MSGVIKQVPLLRWTQNNKTSVKNYNKSWIHPPDALQSGHVVYVVKFLGCTEVEQANGIEVVKESIRKLKFNQQLKKAEGNKVPKVELVVSVEGVSVQEPKTKIILYKYPLHLISYCADDKSDKKIFSFIAKKADSDKHICFVFNSEKLAGDITLTIGQAFDLAYRKFIETTGRDLEIRKQLVVLQKKVEELETENETLRKKLRDFEDGRNETVTKSDNSAAELLIKKTNSSVPLNAACSSHSSVGVNSQSSNYPSDIKAVPPSQDLFDLVVLPPVPPCDDKSNSILVDDVDFNPRGENTFTNGNDNSKTAEQTDLFGAVPFSPSESCNLFGMDDFSSVMSNRTELGNVFGDIDKSILEMNDGFNRGLTFGNDDFSTLDVSHNNP